MKLLRSKKAIITSPVDLFKGLIIGFLIGVLLMFLAAKGIIPPHICPSAVP